MNPIIKTPQIKLGKDVRFGDNVTILARDFVEIGDYSYIGDNCHIEGRSIKIGKYFYNSGGLKAGKGRIHWPEAILEFGDRCTCHNNFIDLARQVTIADDVGLSPETAIYNHGYWMSCLEGYPCQYAPVTIGYKTIIGFRCTILPGVKIGNEVVVGAGSIVTKDLSDRGIYAGNPAKLIKKLSLTSQEYKFQRLNEILDYYQKVCEYRGINPKINIDYPNMWINETRFHVELGLMSGPEDEITDDFRDFIFRYGIKFYSSRGFKIYASKK